MIGLTRGGDCDCCRVRTADADVAVRVHSEARQMKHSEGRERSDGEEQAEGAGMEAGQH